LLDCFLAQSKRKLDLLSIVSKLQIVMGTVENMIDLYNGDIDNPEEQK